MNALEIEELAQKLQDDPALKKTRKPRSDKGEKWGSCKGSDNQRNGPSNSPGTGGPQRNKRIDSTDQE
ncbi:hypothetical protein P691DRAFT_766868 [Macrolepiota fuliginosa MF-IS2]|uniref:Uncharacterized protein n=1 Tax=Macrolepiota fuliginosa MF-IS2 TaxID=1400762 RepID=A0A9P6BX34_9AGAR|nr:hypothetical protein P691DRAFT_766868 [Macrolepiota fuliginosa MF-IS2]